MKTLPILPFLLPITLALASPPPPIVPDAYIYLIPRNTLFFRQTTISNLQSFTSSLGGIPAPPITNSGDPERPFEVDGSTFTDFEAAGKRSCDRQFDSCARSANDNDEEGGLEVGECDGQKDECLAAQRNAPVQEFGNGGGGGGGGGGGEEVVASVNIGPDPQFPDFDLICDA
ncbi:hypothetical protein M011DRAFT_472240 [Sporormia fimetaria CBS 119925]|uniref:Uncharacterized protein n=1 Tax=Sporormia fimetaria CBS 119925 TaxID=1340428 RepID=A0A6A6UVW5_9PLEO|nr:hypothetical protein M011DRAFT_472240 [Sporormia fimetaria CBS 119925]